MSQSSTPQEHDLPCYLFNLPAELRIQIYELLLHHTRTCFITFNGPRTNCHWIRSSPIRAQLLRTCRTIYNEAQPMLLSATTVDIHFGRFDSDKYSEARFTTFVALTNEPEFAFLRSVGRVQICVECDNDFLRRRMMPALGLLVDAMREGESEKSVRWYAGDGKFAIQPEDVAYAVRKLPSGWRVEWDVAPPS